jgi:peptidylprolyl isomerase
MLVLTIFLISCSDETNRTVVLETNQGKIEIELFEDKMPITTKNFIDLVESDFYDGTRFHRVISNFMIQGGDPLSKDVSQKTRWGTGGPGYNIKDEFCNVGNLAGTIAMANAGPNTGGSQFFINLVDNNYLDKMHPVFGKVVSGMEIVQKIGDTKTDSRDAPIEDVIIEKIKIV